MQYAEFQKKRKEWQAREIAERQTDLVAPRPPINASVVDQAIRELYDRVAVLEGCILSAPRPVNSK